jgi:hypothetical protein
LQPAKTPWSLVDEPIVNTHVKTIGELDTLSMNLMQSRRGNLMALK